MKILAHRGIWTPAENGGKIRGNTIWNFKQACDGGVFGIEADVSRTSDGKLIIYHPGTLNPDPSKLTLKTALKTYPDLITLNVLLDFLEKRPHLTCCLDIKENCEKLALTTAQKIEDYRLQEQIYVTAFQKNLSFFGMESSGKFLLRIKEFHPSIKTHLIAMWPNLLKLVDDYNPDAISFGWLLEPALVRLVSKTLFKTAAGLSDLKHQVSEVRRLGKRVWAGIVNNPEDLIYFSNLGVEAVMTDQPREMMEFIRQEKIP